MTDPEGRARAGGAQAYRVSEVRRTSVSMPNLQDRSSVPDPAPRIVFDTSALLDLFGRWTDDHKERRGDLVKEIPILAPLKPFLFSTQAIRREVHDSMVIGADLERCLSFEAVSDAELAACPGFVKVRETDYSLTALTRRFEHEGFRTFLITKDRTFAQDLARAGLRACLVPPTGFADAITVLTPEGSPSVVLAHRIQNNTYENLSRGMRLAQKTHGEREYLDWQEFLDFRTASRYELVEALKATGVTL